jgi:hypothetical protein
MGYIRHHAIVVTGWDEKFERAHAKAVELFKDIARNVLHRKEGRSLVSPIIPGIVNGYKSFFVAPDGSKEGWEESDNANTARDRFVEYLRAQANDDGSTSLRYVEVQFGDDDKETLALRNSDADYEAHPARKEG